MAEASFELAGIAGQRPRFLNVLRALPEHVIRTVNDLLQPDAPADVYVQLRRRLLAAHGLTRYQRLERLSSIQGLGGQKPSELLATLTQLCPPGENNTVLFRFEFLKRLPRELRIIIAEDDADLTALAARADVLWSHNSKAASHTLAAVAAQEDEDEPAAAAVNALQPARGRGGQQRGRGGPQRGRGGGRGRGGTSGAAPAADAPPAEFARAGTGMCFPHFVYGPAARKCGLPGTCTWQGN